MKWTDYTTKETLEDNDELMILDADVKANKRTLMSKIWNYVVDKMTSAVVAKLTTTDKTVLGAINELNSNSLKDYVKIGTYKDLTIKTTGTSISFIVKWENTLHELIYNTNDVLMFRISSDNGQTWTTKKQI
jgi:hypothetical protein